MNFKGKEYIVEINKIDPPMLYGKILSSNILVAEIFWRYMDQDEKRKKCDLPAINFMPAAKRCGLTSDNWNIRDRRNALHAHVYNEVCEAVGLPKINLEAKEKELAQQAPKAYKKSTTVQQAPQVPVQNTKVQELLNSRVQLRGNQQTTTPAQKAMPQVKVWTDGSCLGNPGLGGWAAIFMIGNKVMPIWGSDPKTTNNRMEIMALVEALEWLDRPCDIHVFLDSEYVRKIAVGENKAGKNQDLWTRYSEAVKRHKVVFEHVEAHQDNPKSLEAILNNMADETARDAAEKQLPKPTREQAKAKMTEINSNEFNKVEEVYPDDVDYLPDDDFYEE